MLGAADSSLSNRKIRKKFLLGLSLIIYYSSRLYSV